MKAIEIVTKLLEADPDEVDPKQELLRVDPASDIKEIIHALQNEGILTLAYKRAGDILKLHIKLIDWADNDRLARWLGEFLFDQVGVGVDIYSVTARNLGPDYHGLAYEIMFPLEGQPTPYTKLV